MLETKESSGRTVSFWLSHSEVEALDRAAVSEKITRNKAARRALADYVSKVTDQ